MFMDKKTQYCWNISSSQLDLYIQCQPNPNSNKLFGGPYQTDSKVSTERQEHQNNQDKIEG